jgi:2-dehydro-3-deoxy-D-arabinonate dehydratase
LKIYNTKSGIVLLHSEKHYLLSGEKWDLFINDDDLFDKCMGLIQKRKERSELAHLIEKEILAPIGNQEIWASGVTYYNSKLGREEESREMGGDHFYSRVYSADRPELFFKSTAARAVGHNGYVAIRKDSSWNVPEPELTLMISSSGKIIGYTIGNDMSSRSIEGENPLYLPQAKTYDYSAAIGPCIWVTKESIPLDSKIYLEVMRNNKAIFSAKILVNQIKRELHELVDYLYEACSFPQGCLLMTGTGIVPDSGFTLQSNDEIHISIDHIGTLTNFVKEISYNKVKKIG